MRLFGLHTGRIRTAESSFFFQSVMKSLMSGLLSTTVKICRLKLTQKSESSSTVRYEIENRTYQLDIDIELLKYNKSSPFRVLVEYLIWVELSTKSLSLVYAMCSSIPYLLFFFLFRTVGA